MKTIQQINDELGKISEEYSKLFSKEQKLNKEKQKLLAKITSMEKQVVELKEFVKQFDIVNDGNKNDDSV